MTTQRKIFTAIIFIVGIGYLVMKGCNNPCEKAIKKWQEQATATLTEVKDIDAELRPYLPKLSSTPDSLKAFVKDTLKASQIAGVPLPKLTQWIRQNPEAYISYEGNTIEVQLGYCENRKDSHFSYLYYSATGIYPHFNKSLGKVSSTSLGNNWYFVVTECEGCAK